MATFMLVFVIWAVLHSITADQRVKMWTKQRIGERPYQGLYRLFYNFFAVVTFVPVLWSTAVHLPNRTLWNIPTPWSFVANLIQLLGIIGLAVALFQTDFWDFVGVRQAVRYASGEKEIDLPPKLVTSGMYALVRHPLYFFSLLIIWFTPTMTIQTVLFNIFATMYLWAGSRVEERRLAAFFGPAYDKYRKKVPGLIPIPLRNKI